MKISPKPEGVYRHDGGSLEHEHEGRNVAIAPDAKTVLGDTVVRVDQKATGQFSPGSFLFQMGPIAVYTNPNHPLCAS
jgi:hypothetical protein